MLTMIRLDPSDIIDIYDCSQCSHQTASIFQLDHHVQRKHSNGFVFAAQLFHAVIEPEEFSCICCNYKSCYRFKIYEHYKQTHNSRSRNNKTIPFNEKCTKYHCVNCAYESDSSLSLIMHHAVCKKVIPQLSLDSADVVESLHLNRGDATTSQDVATSKSNLSARDTTKQTEKFECNHCSYRTCVKARLKYHVQAHPANDKEIRWFHCKRCSFRAKHKGSLNMHMLQHATNEEINWFRCDQCSYRAKRKGNLTEHMMKHSTDEEMQFQCHYCSVRTKWKASLKRHMLTHASKEQINWFQCERCPFRAKYKTSVKTHMLQHAADEEVNWFQCDKCSYRSKKNGDLKSHRRTHVTGAEIDWFECDRCTFRTKWKGSFRRHMLQHE